MAGPQLDDGTVIEEADEFTITVRTPAGRRVKVARQSAPQRLQQAVEAPRVSSPLVMSGSPAEQQLQQTRQPEVPNTETIGAAPSSVDPVAIRDVPSTIMRGSLAAQQLQQAGQTQSGLSGAEPSVTSEPLTRITQAVPQQTPQGPQFATATQSQTQRTRTVFDPATQAELDASRERSGEAQQSLTESFRRSGVDAALAGQEATELEEQRRATLQQGQQERSAVEAQNKEREQQIRADMENLRDEIQRAQIDPNRLWANKSTGQKIALAIGAALSGALTRGRGPNSVVQMIEGEIKRDIDAQKTALTGRKQAFQLSERLYGLARQRGLDDLAAKEVAMQTGLSLVESRLRGAAARAQSASAQETLLREADKVTIRAEELRQQAAERQGIKVTRQTSSRQVPVPGAVGSPADASGRPVVIPGLRPTGEATSALEKKDITNLRDGAGAYQSMVESIKQMKRLRQQVGTELTASAADSEFQALATTTIGGLTKLAQTGVLNEGEFQRFKKLMPTDLGPGFGDVSRVAGKDPVLVRLDGVLNAVTRAANANLRSRGFQLQGVGNLRSLREGAR